MPVIGSIFGFQIEGWFYLFIYFWGWGGSIPGRDRPKS